MDWQTKSSQKKHVIARRAKPDVAIRIPSDEKHRPSPMGTEKRTDCHVACRLLAMTW